MTQLGRRLLPAAFVAFAAFGLLAGCGGGTDRTKAHARLVNASAGYARLDVNQAGTPRQTALGYGQTAAYADFDRGSDTDLTVLATGSPTAMVTLRPALAKDQYYTLLAYGGAGALATLMLDDNVGTPASGQTLLRVVNAAPDAGALDVYVTAASDALAAAVPVQAGAAYGVLGSYATLASGSWRLRVAAAGSKNDLRLDVADLTLGSQQLVTLVVTPGAGGVLVNALALVQRGDVARLDGRQARVRAVAGVTAGGAVSASVGGVALLAGIGAPAAGAYQLVAAGAAAPALAVNGVGFTVPAATLAAGADYTLLVYGDAAAPLAAWIADDNRLPATAGQARIRLVNGVAHASGPLALALDYLPIAGGLAAGAASDYALGDASTTAQLAVTATGAAQPLYSASGQTIAAGSVYSVFVLGDAAAPTGVLRKDR